MKCRHDHDDAATAVYACPNGCICFPDPVQALCPQHGVKLLQNVSDSWLICAVNENGDLVTLLDGHAHN